MPATETERFEEYKKEAKIANGWTDEQTEEKFIEMLNRETAREWWEGLESPTSYSASFLVSLQNRWESFDNPHRWAIRFGNDMDTYPTEGYFVGTGLGNPAATRQAGGRTRNSTRT